MRVPTVRVASPADPTQFIIINESDLTEDHELWPEQAEPEGDGAQSDDGGDKIGRRLLARIMGARAGMTAEEWRALPLVVRVAQMQTADAETEKGQDDSAVSRVVKGARGLWFGMRGKVRLTGGFGTEAEAQAALDAVGD